ncbi:MAG: DUF2500 domain-containing protein [Propionibacteriaceae bacterium]|jgi:hypothetical protein|nr:DUF2500 domain-containing protein [Propionibacteriaceae bacterium]
MGIETLDAVFSVFLVFGGIVWLIVVGSFLWPLLKNAGQPVLTSHARVVDERTEISGSPSTHTTYFATFELPSGERVELEVSGSTSGQIVTGDAGMLTWQGTAFKGFQREILR